MTRGRNHRLPIVAGHRQTRRAIDRHRRQSSESPVLKAQPGSYRTLDCRPACVPGWRPDLGSPSGTVACL